MKPKYFILILFFLANTAGFGQPSVRISAENFLAAVSTHPSIGQHADAMEVLDASVDIARVSPDPSLVLGNLSGDVSGINMPHQLFVGFNYTLETGGKRKQRVRHAKAERNLAGLEHVVFVNEFKRDALLVFQNCWVLEQQIHEANQLRSDLLSVRINDTTLLLKQQLLVVENERRLNELEIRYVKATAELNDLVHHAFGDQPVLPDGWAWSYEGDVPAKTNAATVEVTRASVDVLKEEVLLSASNRAPDLSFTLGNSYITRATNQEAPSPSYNALTASVTIPLKFSNLNNASRRMDALRLQNVRSLEVSAVEESDNAWMESVREINRLTESFSQINMVIGLQEKYIAKISAEEPLLLLTELNQLNQYRTQRWHVLENIALQKAELFVRSGILPPVEPTLVSGSH